MFVPDYSYTVTEHDPERPWIVVATRHGQVKLSDDASFFAWAHENWPAPRWSVQLDPWQLSHRLVRTDVDHHAGKTERHNPRRPAQLVGLLLVWRFGLAVMGPGFPRMGRGS
jgi:hypothetical protein